MVILLASSFFISQCCFWILNKWKDNFISTQMYLNILSRSVRPTITCSDSFEGFGFCASSTSFLQCYWNYYLYCALVWHVIEKQLLNKTYFNPARAISAGGSAFRLPTFTSPRVDIKIVRAGYFSNMFTKKQWQLFSLIIHSARLSSLPQKPTLLGKCYLGINLALPIIAKLGNDTALIWCKIQVKIGSTIQMKDLAFFL